MEKVLAASQSNDEFLANMKEERQKLELQLLRDVFRSADRERKGIVSLEDFQDACSRSDVQAIFEELEMPVSRKRLATRLFQVLDAESQGEMDISVFLERAFLLKREGKQIKRDRTMLLMDVRHLSRRLDQQEKQQHSRATSLARLKCKQDTQAAMLQDICTGLRKLESTFQAASTERHTQAQFGCNDSETCPKVQASTEREFPQLTFCP